jgi:hypothetical protein
VHLIGVPLNVAPSELPMKADHKVELLQTAITALSQLCVDIKEEQAAKPAVKEKKDTRRPASSLDGRGGAQHQAIQQRLKAVAEGLGFRAVVENAVLQGRGH